MSRLAYVKIIRPSTNAHLYVFVDVLVFDVDFKMAPLTCVQVKRVCLGCRAQQMHSTERGG